MRALQYAALIFTAFICTLIDIYTMAQLGMIQ